MIRPNRRHLLLLPLVAGAAFAQDEELPLVDEQEEIRRYTVEMIIFTYNEDVSIGSEVFVPDRAPPQDPLLDELGVDAQELTNPDRIRVQGPVDGKPQIVEEIIERRDEIDEVDLVVRRMYDLAMLPEDEYTMNEIYGHLKRLDVYEPVLHFGWTERTVPREEARVRPLSSFVTPPAELGLDGDFQLYLGRYLHLVVNLQLDAPQQQQAVSGYDDYSYSGFQDDRYDRSGVVVPQPVHYRIQEDRIFKSGEIRYFDHPKFGVLATITRWEEPDPEENNEEFLGDAELLGLDGQ